MDKDYTFCVEDFSCRPARRGLLGRNSVEPMGLKDVVPHPAARKTTAVYKHTYNAAPHTSMRKAAHTRAQCTHCHTKMEQNGPTQQLPQNQMETEPAMRCEVSARGIAFQLRFSVALLVAAHLVGKTHGQRTKTSGLTTKRSIPVAKRRVVY